MNRTFLCTIICIAGVSMPALSLGEQYFAEITDIRAGKSRSGAGFSLFATIKSSDINCDHYVNWWEAVSEDGELLYRRVLGHPHSKEQPFSRGSSTDSISEETVFYARAHMHPFGYSQNGMKGSIKNGFTAVTIPDDFASHLADEGEMPSRCNPAMDR